MGIKNDTTFTPAQKYADFLSEKLKTLLPISGNSVFCSHKIATVCRQRRKNYSAVLSTNSTFISLP